MAADVVGIAGIEGMDVEIVVRKKSQLIATGSATPCSTLGGVGPP